jgi:hypothetical protein
MSHAATTPVKKFWKKISTALANNRNNGRVLICHIKGMIPPTVNSSQPVLTIS